MGVCKANLGNLLQHWVLCELLDSLSHDQYSHLLFVCTHSMAPWSVPETVDYTSVRSPRLHRRRPFDDVRKRLFVRPTSSYERYWQSLTSHSGVPYPSSAAFAWSIWPRRLSLLLCEYNPVTADEIGAWLVLPEVAARLTQGRLHQGDWRVGLDTQFANAVQPDLIVIELDPMQFEHRNPAPADNRNGALLYPDDMDRLVTFCAGITTPIIVQASSYDVNNGNSQAHTIPAISKPLLAAGFSEAARVKPNNLMISLVFCRGVTLGASLAALHDRFLGWMRL